MHWDGDWGWWMAVGWLWMVAFWGLIVWAVIYVVRQLGYGGRSDERENDDPIRIVERRYAQGELTREEFEEMREALRRPPPRL